MKVVKNALKVLLVLVVLLVVTVGVYLYLQQKNNPQLLENLRNKFENKSTQPTALNFSGTVVSAYAQGSDFFFKIRDQWRIPVYKDFRIKNHGAFFMTDSPAEATDGAQLPPQSDVRVTVRDLKLGDEVELSYLAKPDFNEITTLRRTAQRFNQFQVAVGQIKQVSADRLTLSLTAGAELIFIIEDVVKMGPKYSAGQLKEYSDFTSLKPETQVQILYEENRGEFLVAKSILILD